MYSKPAWCLLALHPRLRTDSFNMYIEMQKMAVCALSYILVQSSYFFILSSGFLGGASSDGCSRVHPQNFSSSFGEDCVACPGDKLDDDQESGGIVMCSLFSHFTTAFRWFESHAKSLHLCALQIRLHSRNCVCVCVWGGGGGCCRTSKTLLQGPGPTKKLATPLSLPDIHREQTDRVHG